MPSAKVIILGELEVQSTYALRAYSDFEDRLAAGDTYGVFYHLHHFLVHAIAVSRLIKSEKTGPEVRKHLHVDDLDFDNFRRLRNHLEHFDERLARWISDFDGQAFFDLNIVTGANGFPASEALRAIDDHTFLIFGEAFDMRILNNTVQQVLERVEAIR